jgi:uncharacterized protein
MRYWDTSAIVPLLVDEPGSALCRGWLEEDGTVVTWMLSRVELVGAVERRARQDAMDSRTRRALLRQIDRLAERWDEVVDVDAVRDRAVSLLARHPLRAADSLQLGAALVIADGDRKSVEFVCLDRSLADAAEREGFIARTWPES